MPFSHSLRFLPPFRVVDNEYFEVQNGNQLVVKSLINYHVTGINIAVQVKATDSGGLSFTQTVPVVIQDVNDPADALVTFCNIDEDRCVPRVSRDCSKCSCHHDCVANVWRVLGVAQSRRRHGRGAKERVHGHLPGAGAQ